MILLDWFQDDVQNHYDSLLGIEREHTSEPCPWARICRFARPNSILWLLMPIFHLYITSFLFSTSLLHSWLWLQNNSRNVEYNVFDGQKQRSVNTKQVYHQYYDFLFYYLWLGCFNERNVTSRNHTWLANRSSNT